MFSKFLKLIFSLLFLAACPIFVSAQACNPIEPQQDIRRTPVKEEVPQGIKENLAKMCIEQQKKEYAELLKRGDEALKLSEELEKSFSSSNTLSSEDKKKLDRLEKLVKKIRSDLGGDDDGQENEVSEDNEPLSMANAFNVLKENTVKLVSELKKSTRYTISAVAINSSNLLLKVVKFLRFVK
jgi:hypothetical protein